MALDLEGHWWEYIYIIRNSVEGVKKSFEELVITIIGNWFIVHMAIQRLKCNMLDPFLTIIPLLRDVKMRTERGEKYPTYLINGD